MSGVTTATYIAIASAAATAYGAYSEADAAKKQAKAQSRVAANNAIIAENNAKYQETRARDALDRGQTEANQRRRQIAQLEGTQRSSLAGAGVSINSGSPLDVFSDTQMLGNQDIATIKKNSENESMGYRMNAYNYRASGDSATAESNMYSSKASSISPTISAASSALSSASSVSSKWNTFSDTSSQNYYSSGYYNPGTYNAGAASNGLPWSDIRLKHSIEPRGQVNGINVYEFSYIGKTKRFIGVMAHEVAHIAGAVARRGKFLCVDYSKLDGIEYAEVA